MRHPRATGLGFPVGRPLSSSKGSGFWDSRQAPRISLPRLHSVTVVRLRNSPLTEPCSVFPVPILSKSVKKTAKKNALQVCLLSPHPLVLSEFERVLASPDFKTISKH